MKKSKQNKTLAILHYWNSLGLRKHIKPDSKVYKKSIKNINLLLQGKFVPPAGFDRKYENRKYSKAEIMIAIQRFSVSALRPDYVPVNKEYMRKMSLCDFIYSPFVDDDKWKSMFLFYLENKPKKLKVTKKDKYPNTTEKIIELYKQNIGQEIKRLDVKHAIKASLLLHEFMKENSRKFKSDLTLKALTKILIQTISERFGDNINPSYLSAAFVYSDLLRKKLKQMRYM